MRPRPSVDSRVGRYVADAEFAGQLLVSQAIRPPRPQLPHFLGGQLGPGISLADRAIVATVAFAAPRLESDPDVIAGGVGRGPVLGPAAAINAPVIAGWPAGILDTVMPDVIRGPFRPQGGTGQLVPAPARAAPAIPPDPGEPPADRAPLPFVSGFPARAPARPRVTRHKRAKGGCQLVSAVALAQDSPVSSPADRGLPHFGDDGEFPVFLAGLDGMLHNSDSNLHRRTFIASHADRDKYRHGPGPPLSRRFC